MTYNNRGIPSAHVASKHNPSHQTTHPPTLSSPSPTQKATRVARLAENPKEFCRAYASAATPRVQQV